MKKNILILCGGGHSEHEISLISSQYIYDSLKDNDQYNVYHVTILHDGRRIDKEGKEVELRRAGEIAWKQGSKKVELHYAIPCIHGPPGETGEIQAVFELMGLPYLGCSPEANILCFNKVSSKLWFDALKIKNTPFLFLDELNTGSIQKAHDFFDLYQGAFIKAASQGSSVGCYPVTKKEELQQYLKKAFKLSQYVLVEKPLKARELEIAAFEHDGKLYISHPGEIICPGSFYSFEEKYDQKSHTTTEVEAKNLTVNQVEKMRELARKAFTGLKLSDLSRIDFFLTEDGEIYLNEINTFPGMTPISMFPKMMENMGVPFKTYLSERIQSNARS